MAKDLTGKRIVIGASRKTEEMSALIEKQGGIPIIRPLQGTVFLAEKKVEPKLTKLIQERIDWAVFTTGIGIETLMNIADKLGVKEDFLNLIHRSKIASRGYKTLSTLKKLGVTPAAVDEDGTTRSLIKSLEGYDFNGKRVMVQLHGETAPALIQYLEDKGATVTTILPYEHIPPQIETLAALYEELQGNIVDAVCFTTGAQVRSLFNFAREKDCVKDLLSCFQSKALAVAVGKVTADALREEGLERFIVPEHERMGAMVIELCHYFRNHNI
jgi:uroporphyrinogen-III synthase